MDQRIHRTLRATALLLAALLLPHISGAQELKKETPKRTYRVMRTSGIIRVDGKLDDAAWSGPPTMELAYETRPAENGPAPVKTEVWMTYDDSNLYAAFRAHDPDPKQIRARYSDRDAALNDDFLGFVFDTFNDRRRAFEFFVNPLGVQMDLTQNEMTGNEDSSWDAIWDSAGRITADGYEVELRIPFSSLRFPSTAAEMTWGIDAVRNYPRGPGYRLGLQPQDRGINCYLCQASSLVGITGVRAARSIELDPTFTASQTAERAAFPTGRFETGDPKTEVGLTTQWGITPNFTFSGALNPDFSQIEADAAQLAVNKQFASGSGHSFCSRDQAEGVKASVLGPAEGSKLLFSGSAQNESAHNRSNAPFSNAGPRSGSVGPEFLKSSVVRAPWLPGGVVRSRSDYGLRVCLSFTEAGSASTWSANDRQPRERRGHAWLICVRPRVSRTRNRQTPAGPDPLAGFARTPESGR